MQMGKSYTYNKNIDFFNNNYFSDGKKGANCPYTFTDTIPLQDVYVFIL